MVLGQLPKGSKRNGRYEEALSLTGSLKKALLLEGPWDEGRSKKAPPQHGAAALRSKTPKVRGQKPDPDRHPVLPESGPRRRAGEARQA